MICPTIDISGYKSKEVFDAISKSKTNSFTIINPSVYLSDGSTKVIKGTFTIKKLN